MVSLIRVLAIDIDGCLVPVQHAPYELEAVAEIARLQRASRTDRRIPELTILSGRPHAYVDAVMQLLDIRAPASFENGAGIAYRDPYGFELAPAADARRDELAVLARELGTRNDLIVQPGKVASLSVFAYPGGGEVERVRSLVADLISSGGLDLEVEPSQDCVNVLVPGIDKDFGLTSLTEELEVGVDQIAGIGDSFGDAAWLGRCAASCAPANAHASVKDVATFRSEHDDVTALLEFYRHLIDRNEAAV